MVCVELAFGGTLVKAVMFTQQATITVVDKDLQLTVRQTLALDSSLLPPHLTLILFLDLGTNLQRKPWCL